MILIETQHLPPSTNGLFVNLTGKGRVRSKGYRDWQDAAGWDFNGRGTLSGPFIAVITVDRHRRDKRRDIDNFIKPILDLLVKHRVVDDDRLCEEVHAMWGHAPAGLRIEIRGPRT